MGVVVPTATVLVRTPPFSSAEFQQQGFQHMQVKGQLLAPEPIP